jgi:mannosylfructose-phosphate synthase
MPHDSLSCAAVLPAAIAALPAWPEHLGYDEQRFFPFGPTVRERLRARFGFHGRVIVSLGAACGAQLEPLINAFALVARRVPEARLYLAVVAPDASGAERRQFAALTRRVERTTLLRGRVRLGPTVTEDDRPDLYRAADAFACAGDDELAEICALEAMASGTPTVVSVHGQLQRCLAFGRHALHAAADDAIDFGLTLTRLLRDGRLRRRLVRMGAHQARSLFSAGPHRTGASLPCPREPHIPRVPLQATA